SSRGEVHTAQGRGRTRTTVPPATRPPASGQAGSAGTGRMAEFHEGRAEIPPEACPPESRSRRRRQTAPSLCVVRLRTRFTLPPESFAPRSRRDGFPRAADADASAATGPCPPRLHSPENRRPDIPVPAPRAGD